MDEPLVSIVTVVLNGERELANTIESVLQQRYKNLQYVLIDGGSTDGTIDVIRRYEHRLDYWVSEPDSGISHAFNKGLAATRGDLIGILNCGDWYEPEAVSTVARLYSANPAIDVFCGAVQYWRNGKRNLVCVSDPTGLRRGMTVYHPAVFATKLAFEKFGHFDTDYVLAMDYELLLRYTMLGARFMSFPTPITNITFDGRSTKYWLEGLREVRKARRRYFSPYNVAFNHYSSVAQNITAKLLQTGGLERLYHRYWEWQNQRRNSGKKLM